MSSQEKIQIGVPCGLNSEHYVKHLIYTSDRTAHTPSRLEFLLGVNDEGVDSDFLSKIETKSKVTLVDATNEFSVSSKGHGVCLNTLFGSMTEKYGMIVDCDVAFLAKGWDDILLSMLQERVVIIGSEYNGSKYLKFPNAICCMFIVDLIRQCKVSFLPAEKRQLTLDHLNCRLFGREPDEVIDLDVGWELPYKIKIAGGEGIAMPLISAKDERSKFMIDEMRGEEHQLNSEPIFTHVGRSSYRDFINDPIVQMWCNRVKEWIEINE